MYSRKGSAEGANWFSLTIILWARAHLLRKILCYGIITTQKNQLVSITKATEKIKSLVLQKKSNVLDDSWSIFDQARGDGLLERTLLGFPSVNTFIDKLQCQEKNCVSKPSDVWKFIQPNDKLPENSFTLMTNFLNVHLDRQVWWWTLKLSSPKVLKNTRIASDFKENK